MCHTFYTIIIIVMENYMCGMVLRSQSTFYSLDAFTPARKLNEEVSGPMKKM